MQIDRDRAAIARVIERVDGRPTVEIAGDRAAGEESEGVAGRPASQVLMLLKPLVRIEAMEPELPPVIVKWSPLLSPVIVSLPPPPVMVPD